MEKELIEKYMEEALLLANEALKNNEIPVGAIIVDQNGNIIGKGQNTREETKNILGHAEINALIDASKNLNKWQLDDCTLFVTLEPCLMCLGALTQAHIKKIYIGIKDNKISNNERNIRNDFCFENKIDINYGVLEQKISDFFSINMRKIRK